ncbi:Phox-like protein [Gigaspora margarita]|uniref:Phox-like protein n=1 Tax=Gigaspora margarita TaxID=4874 RepID=A0A8H3XF06_GIGMA|nr:Phox-like protein [Gigaspora margarita]
MMTESVFIISLSSLLTDPLLLDFKCKVSIPGWTLVDALLGLDKYVSYQIVCRYWVHGHVGKLFINRRYTDFDKLHKRLVHKYGKSAIPPLTPKKRYGRFNLDFIEYRRFHLEFYLQYLALTNRDELIKFLGGTKQGTKIITDGGPKNTSKTKSNKSTKSDLPQRGCLISGSRRNEKIRVHFADEVVDNEKASRNPATKHHVAQNSNITYYM